MSLIREHSRLLSVAVCCVALGAGASAIASAGASTPSAGTALQHGGLRAGGMRRLAKRAVHGDLVLATRRGFVTVTFDRGKIDSVNGQQLTISEGTRHATYKTVTLTIPTNARIRDNRQKASMAALQNGQRVLVILAPKRTLVIARTPRGG
jgi:hypothetical protein